MKVAVRSAMLPLVDLIPQAARNVRSHLGDVSELADSIRAHGILQPLVVAPQGARYRIIAGHRRHRAAAQVGLTHVPCTIREGQPASTDRVLMLIENVHRQDLSPMDVCQALVELRRDHTLDEVARMTGLSPTTIASRINLLSLPPALQQQVRAKELPLREAESIARQVRSTGRASAFTGPKAGAKYFGAGHRLAATVRASCPHREGQRVLYGPGCGACWEAAIRADELAHVEDQVERAAERSA